MNALFVVYCKLNTRTYMFTQSHTVVSKRFCLQWKAFDLFYRMRYKFMGGGAAGEPQRHKHGHHLGRHVGFNQDLAVR